MFQLVGKNHLKLPFLVTRVNFNNSGNKNRNKMARSSQLRLGHFAQSVAKLQAET